MEYKEYDINGKSIKVFILNDTNTISMKKEENLYRDVHAYIKVINQNEVDSLKDAWNYDDNTAYIVCLQNLSKKLLYKINYNYNKINYYNTQLNDSDCCCRDFKNGLANTYNNYIIQNRKNIIDLNNGKITVDLYNNKLVDLQKRVNIYTYKNILYINYDESDPINFLKKTFSYKNDNITAITYVLDSSLTNNNKLFTYLNSKLSGTINLMIYNEDEIKLYHLDLINKYLIYVAIEYKFPFNKLSGNNNFYKHIKHKYFKKGNKFHRWAYNYIYDNNSKHKRQIRKNLICSDNLNIDSKKYSIFENGYNNIKITKDDILTNSSKMVGSSRFPKITSKYNIWKAIFKNEPKLAMLNKICSKYPDKDLKKNNYKKLYDEGYDPYYVSFKFILQDSHGRKINTLSNFLKFYFKYIDYSKNDIFSKNNYLQFKCINGNCNFIITKKGNINAMFEYCINTNSTSSKNLAWTQYEIGNSVPLQTNNILYLRRNIDDGSNGYLNTGYDNYCTINFEDTTNKCKIIAQGDIQYMLYGTLELDDDKAKKTSEYCFYKLFNSCNCLINTPELTAIDLGIHCYEDMFLDCKGLTAISDIKVDILSEACCKNMFCACTALEKADIKLTAPELKKSCYESMFKGCTSLKKLPYIDIKDTSINEIDGLNACKSMFEGCTSLTNIVYINNYNTENRTIGDSMFKNCKNITSLFLDADTKIIYLNLFIECTSLSKVTYKYIDGIKVKYDTFTNATDLVERLNKNKVTAYTSDFNDF